MCGALSFLQFQLPHFRCKHVSAGNNYQCHTPSKNYRRHSTHQFRSNPAFKCAYLVAGRNENLVHRAHSSTHMIWCHSLKNGLTYHNTDIIKGTGQEQHGKRQHEAFGESKGYCCQTKTGYCHQKISTRVMGWRIVSKEEPHNNTA